MKKFKQEEFRTMLNILLPTPKETPKLPSVKNQQRKPTNRVP